MLKIRREMGGGNQQCESSLVYPSEHSRTLAVTQSLLGNIARLLDPEREVKPASAVVLELCVAAAEAFALARSHEVSHGDPVSVSIRQVRLL